MKKAKEFFLLYLFRLLEMTLNQKERKQIINSKMLLIL